MGKGEGKSMSGVTFWLSRMRTLVRASLRRLLERNDYKVSEASSVHEAELSYTLTDFNLIISDLRLPGSPGTEMIQLAVGTPVLIMTSYASLNSAVNTMKMGAVDYIAKPFDHGEMLERVSDIMSRHPVKTTQDSADADDEVDAQGFNSILGQCEAMHLLFRRIRKVAPTMATV